MGAEQGGFLTGGLNAAIGFLKQNNDINGRFACERFVACKAVGALKQCKPGSQVPLEFQQPPDTCVCVFAVCWSVLCVWIEVAVCRLNVA